MIVAMLNVTLTRHPGVDDFLQAAQRSLMRAEAENNLILGIAAGLAKAGTPPETLETTATVTFDKVGADWTVVSSALEVTGVVPGIDAAAFAKAAEGAKDGCPISRALKGNVAMTVQATLEGEGDTT